MSDQVVLLLILFAAVVGILGTVLVILLFKKRPVVHDTQVASVSIHSSIQHVREFGQLLVFRAVTKEVVTSKEEDVREGMMEQDFKAIIICEFNVDFRYDLRQAEFQLIPEREKAFRIRFPKCKVEVSLRKVPECYHTEKITRLAIFGTGTGSRSDEMSNEQLNKLLRLAQEEAETCTKDWVTEQVIADAERSAITTLRSICAAFEITDIQFEFHSDRADIKIAPPDSLEATQP